MKLYIALHRQELSGRWYLIGFFDNKAEAQEQIKSITTDPRLPADHFRVLRLAAAEEVPA